MSGISGTIRSRKCWNGFHCRCIAMGKYDQEEKTVQIANVCGPEENGRWKGKSTDIKALRKNAALKKLLPFYWSRRQGTMYLKRAIDRAGLQL